MECVPGCAARTPLTHGPGDQNNVELIQLPAGSLNLVRPDSAKNAREYIYKDALATIRRTSTPHNYQLVVTRAFEEGEEQLLEGDEESEDERSFLIDENLCFHASTFDGEPTFVWRDWDGGADDYLEFVVDAKQVNAVTRSIFEVTYLQCAWERKTGRGHEEATDEDLERLKYKWVARASSTLTASATSDVAAHAAETQTASRGAAAPKTESVAREPIAKQAERPRGPVESLQSITGTSEPQIVLATRADLYLYDQASGLFMRQEKDVVVRIAEAGRFLCTSCGGSALTRRLDGGRRRRLAVAQPGG